MLSRDVDPDVDVDVHVADVISNVCHAMCYICVLSAGAWPRMGMRPAIRIRAAFCNMASNLQMRIDQTPGLGGPAWQTANGTWPIGTGNGICVRVCTCLFAINIAQGAALWLRNATCCA